MIWDAVEIGAICERCRAIDPRGSADFRFRYIDISGMDRETKRIKSAPIVFESNAPIRARQVVNKADVLVSTLHPNLNAVAMVPDELDGEIASTALCVLRARNRIVDPRFIFYFARSRPFIDALLQRIQGTTRQAATDHDVRAVKIPLPPLSEQRRIVEILDQADAILQQRRASDGKMRRIGYFLSKLPGVEGKLGDRVREASDTAIAAEDVFALKIQAHDDKNPPHAVDALATNILEISYRQAQSTHRAQKLFTTLLHRAFTGELTSKWRETEKARLDAEMRQRMAAIDQMKAANEPLG